MLKFTTFLIPQSEHTILTSKNEIRILTESGSIVTSKQSVFEIVFEVLSIAATMLLFVLQHNAIASEWWKKILTKLDIVTSQRAL